MLESVKEILERNMQEADREVYSAFCEYIAISKTHKSKSDEHTRAYRETPEGRQKHRDISNRSYRKKVGKL